MTIHEYLCTDCQTRERTTMLGLKCSHCHRPIIYIGEADQLIPYSQQYTNLPPLRSLLVKSEGKPDLSLVPPSFREYAAKAFGYGIQKHGRWSWRDRGYQWTDLYAALERHLDAFVRKEDTDPESGLSHLTHAAANLAMLIEHVEKNLGEDNR